MIDEQAYYRAKLLVIRKRRYQHHDERSKYKDNYVMTFLMLPSVQNQPKLRSIGVELRSYFW